LLRELTENVEQKRQVLFWHKPTGIEQKDTIVDPFKLLQELAPRFARLSSGREVMKINTHGPNPDIARNHLATRG